MSMMNVCKPYNYTIYPIVRRLAEGLNRRLNLAYYVPKTTKKHHKGAYLLRLGLATAYIVLNWLMFGY